MIVLLLLGVCVGAFYFGLALLRPRVAIGILVLTLLLWPSYIVVMPAPGLPGINAARGQLLILAFVWIVYFTMVPGVRRRLGLSFRDQRFTWFCIVGYFLTALIVSIAFSAEPKRSIFGAVNQMISYPFLAVLIVSFYRSSRQILGLLAVVFIGAILVDIIALIEFSAQRNLFAGIAVPVTEAGEQILAGKTRGGLHRVSSTFTNPLTLSHFLVFLTPLAIYLATGKNRLFRRLGMLQLVIGVLALLATQSRAGITLGILLILAFTTVALWWPRAALSLKVTFGTLAAVAAVVALAWVGPTLWEAMTYDQTTASSTNARLLQYQMGIPAIMRQPIFGYGVLQAGEQVRPLRSIDNYYLTAALETGLVGLTFLVAMQAGLLRSFWRTGLPRHVLGSRWPFGVFATVAALSLFLIQVTLSLLDAYSYLFILFGCSAVLRSSTTASYPVSSREAVAA